MNSPCRLRSGARASLNVALRRIGRVALLGSTAVALVMSVDAAVAQTELPRITVKQPKPQPKRTAAARKPTRARAAPPAPAQAPPPSEAAQLAATTTKFDQARDKIFAPLGTQPYVMSHETIAAQPQGSNASLDKVLLQAPGVSQDSAASGNLHVRNEHGNVQYRINGIAIPDGVGGFAQILDTGLVGNVALITGALPAQYGLHTAGVVDIQTRNGAFENGGSVSVYGGSHGSITPSFEYGGTVGKTEYFFTGRYLQNDLGIENPTSSNNAIHDHTEQESGFGYMSTWLDDATRFSVMAGTSNKKFQIPNNPGQMPGFTAFGVSDFDSSLLNENQIERTHFAVAAVQRSLGDVDLQLAYFTRYSTLHFSPDQLGDLIFNGVASDVYRRSYVNGIQGDGAWRVNETHTLRAGIVASGESTDVISNSLVLPTDPTACLTSATLDVPCGRYDESAKLGWLLGLYVQDEWKLTDQLTLNYGLRFDQMWQYVDANQFSPRISLTWKPFESTTFHAGYARYFTPPDQVIAAPTNTALFLGTTQDVGLGPFSPVLPERSNVFDVGVTQIVFPGLTVGIDAYYKRAQDLLDDGQFGAAYVLNGFNYAQGENEGVEWSATYKNGNFQAYGNLAWAKQKANNIVSNQFLFGADKLAFIVDNWIYTDHAQLWTGSAGASYLWQGTRLSASMIYGSGLRAGFANTDHVPAYTQVNLGVSHEFTFPDWKPVTARFDIVNVFDSIYEIRDGSGIGVFAPQFGPRRGYYFGLSQKL